MSNTKKTRAKAKPKPKKKPATKPTFKMSKEQRELFSQLTNLQKNIVTHAVSGKSNIDAYLLGGGKAKTRETQESCASEIMHNPKVKAFMDSMREASVSKSIMEREEAMQILSDMARADISEIVEVKKVLVENEDGDGTTEQLILAVKEGKEDVALGLGSIADSEVVLTKNGVKVRQSGRQSAIKMLADMQGWNKPTEIKAVITQEDRIKTLSTGHVVKDEPLA